MKAVFLASARLEERQAAAWYRAENPQLAMRFRVELRAVLERIVETPHQFPFVSQRERRALLNVFPYAVIFEEIQDLIVVIAVAHTRRQPLYWRNRTT